MRYVKLFLEICFFIVSFTSTIEAQDPQFSQFYTHQLTHNPAFTGNTGGARIILNNRIQWLALGQPYKTYDVSYDTYLDGGIAIGGQISHDQQATNFQTNTISALGSYWLKFNDEGDKGLTFGFKGSFINRSTTLEGLKFIDQYSASGISSQSNDPLTKANVLNQSYPDFSMGFLFENYYTLKNRASGVFNPNKHGYQLGVAIIHLDKIFGGQDFTLPLPHLGIHASYKFPVNFNWWEHQDNQDESTMSVSGYLRKQGQNMMLDFGINARYSPAILGIWYRGIPLRRYKDTVQQDALVLLLGYELAKVKFGLSYDVTISSLSWSSGGTFELSAWFGLGGRVNFMGTKRNNERATDCEKFRKYRPW
ncbi:PorP/SprF family type IX secretion system membrane protein [Arcicella sp. LKC2W]|uniref:PorP/SprF family type IX secretion system membrane protein n=1 Tax=Arcicella sp. LKC2W TaxID=2984198 RepID=UPI002B1FF09B|nr:PorP/SprF family type IX secretion system membrane protein [Arcicella sp. LKC2W]MEA5461069.1 PorP/SprF family type IX secretion system membrane protein [Arcicella sp. LKC2W]